ncbi:GNAT family N-acetyltransferase [Microbacterium sp. CIAB417]|uniref:GNAT family N-acetyltransferase n=1 Tax=Microbacterium sp. CIAB417 TaxID=2860287 RepID=UPI001FAD78BF|nr:GNAT family N-acetyltransferase [Microbacterium sp. CIAB417]
MTDARSIPVDPTSAERLSAQDLTYRLIDTSSDADTEAFLRADARGFLDSDPSAEQIDGDRPGLTERRNIGVFPAAATEGSWPIATVNSWATPLTVPGGEVEMWAISSVTVAGTHRRRGIARALLEGELRAAAGAGVPVAGLTASEATIYGRYGFASAIPVARVKIDTRRAGWIGPDVPGRVEYIDRETLKAHLGALHEVARTQRPGQIAGWDGRWARMAGLSAGHPSATAIRGVHYRDADGAVRGVLAYKLTEVPGAFRFALEVHHLSAVTPDALVALWSFAVQHDLVDTVTADLRPVDDPVTWLVADQRAVEVTVHDHGWLRILDVPGVLGARTYRAALDAVLRVEDPLGFADGAWRLVVGADGRASVSAVADDAPADAVLDIAALSAMCVGGVSAVRLRAAGRLKASAEMAASLDDAFRAAEAPLLAIWY